MKLELNKSWYKKHFSMPDDCEVDVPFRGFSQDHKSSEESAFNDDLPASTLAALITLLRRDRSMSVEQLASELGISTPEMLLIEHGTHCLPSPRVVTELARVFNLSEQALQQLTKAPLVQESELSRAASHFVAQAAGVLALTPQEQANLREFVEVLSAHETA